MYRESVIFWMPAVGTTQLSTAIPDDFKETLVIELPGKCTSRCSTNQNRTRHCLRVDPKRSESAKAMGRSRFTKAPHEHHEVCLLYTSDAADEEDSVDLGGRRIIKKKKKGEKQ
eukprot:TRINITY_DN1392_c0_g1_i17.p1 TRINITY_DN1392_c0_g1~~TRINITY_DN1392_c0_g1_i17.p1  ORF type:complete len:114 (-),score=12.47 TRINITY_DN1392_c0_g1_i17:120-461(-)